MKDPVYDVFIESQRRRYTHGNNATQITVSQSNTDSNTECSYATTRSQAKRAQDKPLKVANIDTAGVSAADFKQLQEDDETIKYIWL